MTDRRPAIEIVEEMWRETTDAPMPPPLRVKISNLMADIWVEGYKQGRVDGWNSRNEEA